MVYYQHISSANLFGKLRMMLLLLYSFSYIPYGSCSIYNMIEQEPYIFPINNAYIKGSVILWQ